MKKEPTFTASSASGLYGTKDPQPSLEASQREIEAAQTAASQARQVPPPEAAQTQPQSIPSVTSKRQRSKAKNGILFVLFVGAIAAMLAGGLYYWGQGIKKAETPKEDAPQLLTSSRSFTRIPLPVDKEEPKEEKKEEPAAAPVLGMAPPPPVQPPLPEPQPQVAGFQGQGQEQRPMTLSERRYAAPLLFTTKTAPGAATGEDSQGNFFGNDRDNGFAANLRPTPTPAVSASIIKERSLTLSKGTFIDCILETKLDTSVPGMTFCIIPRNIYSADGRVLLIEKGSRATGEYRGAVQNGLGRIFVLWTQIETPHGVVIAFNSPGTDGLGGAGLPGYVDNHWWARFGNALLFSLIQDGFDYATAQATNANGGVNYYSNSEEGMKEIIREAMQQSGRIPPTLTKNQGERIGIMTARNLYFGTVYGLQTK